MTMRIKTRPAICAFAVVTAALWAPGASAQPLRPNILFIFDTSTSMLSNGGDGSAGLCGGVGTDSRIFRLKQAIRNTLAEVGTDEANFGLARFPELTTPATDRGCYRGHYINSVAPASGCKTSVASETSDGAWLTPMVLSEFVVVPVTKNVPPAASDYDPAGAHVVTIHGWIDNVEASNGTVMTDPEIRSGGPGTPLGNTLFYTRLYFQKYVKVAADPKLGCRKNIAILVTDGVESCGGDPVTRAQELYDSGVELYVVVQLGEAGTVHDDIANKGSGGKRTQSIKVDFTNPDATKAALIGIIAETVPPAEVCNGVDDNCNGQIDEPPLPGVGDACLCPGLLDSQVGKGMCKKGVTVCKGAAGIACEGCVLPTAEKCNGLDDNCNGEIDEGFALGQRCDNGLKGACKRFGSTVCKPDGTGVFCDAVQVTGTTEICNNIDDDCDGMVDEAPLPGNDEPCGSDLGVCMAGKTRCENGKFVCDGTKLNGTPEVCNGNDDNCNGLIDEGIDGIGKVCACAPYTLQTLMTGECRPGALVCKGREPLDCEGCVLPRTEVCDGKDNNCDGMIDEMNPCQDGRVCMGGKCEILCKNDEFRCPTGYECDEKAMPPICRSLKCANKMCQAGWRCDEGSGECVDLCAGVVCLAPKLCKNGTCQDCYTAGCPTRGDLCLDGKCQPNPCLHKTCDINQYCDEHGDCVSSCYPGCAPGQRCLAGACQNDPCASVNTCTSTEVCDPATGECKADLCKLSGKTCPGKKCVPTSGQCKDDPCLTVRCTGDCYACRMTDDGFGICEPQRNCEPHTTLVRVGGPGCACTLPGSPPTRGGGSAGYLLLLTVIVVHRRRRRS